MQRDPMGQIRVEGAFGSIGRSSETADRGLAFRAWGGTVVQGTAATAYAVIAWGRGLHFAAL